MVFSVPSDYSDLTYKPSGADRPNPRRISNALLHGPSGLPSYTNKTVLFVFFGMYEPQMKNSCSLCKLCQHRPAPEALRLSQCKSAIVTLGQSTNDGFKEISRIFRHKSCEISIHVVTL